MQTIDAIRRTNELSKVLKQHGFAKDSFQAVHQAQESLGAENEVLDYEVPGAEAENKFLQKLANLERSKHHLSGRLDAAQKAQEETQAQLKQVLSRLDGAEAKLRALRNQPQQAENSMMAPQESPASATRAEQPAAQQQSAPQPAEQERHPRQAKIDAAYSIENVFYYGNK